MARRGCRGSLLSPRSEAKARLILEGVERQALLGLSVSTSDKARRTKVRSVVE